MIRTIGNILWFVLAGFWMALGYLIWGIALLITIVTINLVGDRLRDVLNPRLQR